MSCYHWTYIRLSGVHTRWIPKLISKQYKGSKRGVVENNYETKDYPFSAKKKST